MSVDILADPDVWWHLRLGQLILDTHSIPRGEPFSYTGPGSPFTAHEWLADVSFALLRNLGGILLVGVVMGAVALGGFVVIWRRARLRGVGAGVCAAGLLLAVKAAQPVLGTRPQVASFALCGVVLLIADVVLRGRRWQVLWLPPIFLLWANLHAGFVIGLGFLGLVIAVEVVRSWLHGSILPRSDTLWLAGATIVGAAVACFNPQGPGLYRFALVTSASERTKPIVEWQPPNFADPGLGLLLIFLLTFVALLVATLVNPQVRGEVRPRDVVGSLVALGLCLYGVRNTAIAVGVMAPLWMHMAQLVALRRGVRRRRPARRGTLGAVVVGTAVVVVVLVGRVVTAASPSGIAAAYPACAVDRLATAPGPQRVMASYGDAGYVIYRLWPKATIYEYGESISLGRAVFDDYLRIAGDQQTTPTARELLDASGTTAVLTRNSALAADLRGHGWTLAVQNQGAYLLARGQPAWATDASPCSR